MAFIDIKDPNQRERIVQDYINTLKDVRNKAENDKAVGLQQQIQLQKSYTPLISATQESTKQITEELKNNRAINEKGYWQESFAKPAIDYYLGIKTNIDKYYGIQKKGDQYIMGNKTVTFDNKSDIIIDNETFKGTPGLWELIMLLKPTNYTVEDFHRYEDLVEKTQVIFNPQTQKPGDRPRNTVKYKDILSQLEETYEQEEDEDEQTEGEGIQFLPGNISGLLDRLKLLYAERDAGNIKNTTNEIVGILDELLRLNYLSREQYNAVCKTLSC